MYVQKFGDIPPIFTLNCTGTIHKCDGTPSALVVKLAYSTKKFTLDTEQDTVLQSYMTKLSSCGLSKRCIQCLGKTK